MEKDIIMVNGELHQIQCTIQNHYRNTIPPFPLCLIMGVCAAELNGPYFQNYFRVVFQGSLELNVTVDYSSSFAVDESVGWLVQVSLQGVLGFRKV